MSFFNKVGSVFKSIFSFFSKNTNTLVEAAVIAETVTGNADLIATTKAVGKAVEQGATVLNNLESANTAS